MKKLFLIICINIILLACNSIQENDLQQQEKLGDSIVRIKLDLDRLDKFEVSIFTKHHENIEKVNEGLDSIRQLRRSWRLRLDTLVKEYNKLKSIK